MAKKEKMGTCVICGNYPVAITLDHIPAKTFFSKPYPKNLITVPACEACNNGSSKNDERFAYFLSLLVGQHTPTNQEYFQQTLNKLKKNAKARMKLIAGSVRANLLTASGIFVEQGYVYKMDDEDQKIYNDSIIKMVKGLYYWHFKEVLNKDGDVHFEVLRQIGFNPALRDILSDFVVAAKGEFVYLYGRLAKDLKVSVWYFQFYSNHWVACLSYPKEFSELVVASKKKATAQAS